MPAFSVDMKKEKNPNGDEEQGGKEEKGNAKRTDTVLSIWRAEEFWHSGVRKVGGD